MDLFFLRHGVAADKSSWTAPDAERPLTEAGRVGVERVAEAMLRLGLDFQRIVTSPFARASQTAVIVARRLGAADRLDEDPRLEPGFDRDKLQRILVELDGLHSILLVGHDPDFSDVIGALIGGGRLRCKKASLARVEVTRLRPLRGELVWLIQPQVWL